LAAGLRPDGTYQRVWFAEPVPLEEVAFEHDVYLVRKDRARALKAALVVASVPVAPAGGTEPGAATTGPELPSAPPGEPPAGPITIRIAGAVPPEVWNRLGTRLIPKLRTLKGLEARAEFCVEVEAASQAAVLAEVRAVLEELGLAERLRVEQVPR
jgi:hypothetical protein